MYKNYKTMHSLLKEPRSPLAKIYNEVAQLKYINQQIMPMLPPSLQTNCQVTGYNQGALRFLAKSGAVATQLRYLGPDLIKHLLTVPRWKELHEICVTVGSASISTTRPSYATQNEPLTLSESAANQMKILADSVDSAELRSSLQRLAKHGKKAQ